MSSKTQYLNIVTQTSNPPNNGEITAALRRLEDLIIGVDKKVDDVKSDIRVMDTRLIEVEKKIDKLDTRLWAFVAILLTATLGALWKLLTVPSA